MDGGGRVAEPLKTGSSGGAPARAATGRRSDGGQAGGLPARGILARGCAAGGHLASLPGRLFRASPRLFLGRRRRSSVAVPLARRLPSLTGTGLVLAFFAGIGGYGLVANGGYAELVRQYGEPRDRIAAALGFGLDKITISGIARLPEREILRLAGITPRTSLPFIGAADIRERLLAEPFIKSADVRKLYPNALAITLVEREPYGLWQLNGELFVVAADGTPIDRLRDPTLATLPLVVGEGANLRAAEYLALLDAAGPLRSKIRAGTLVSGRRWTLKMQNGLDVRMPEEGARAAMARLVRLDRESGLLDKDVLAIDLRMQDRIVVRLTEEAAAARTEGVKKKIQRGLKGIDT